MEIHEMKVGAVYRCKGGWYRRLTSIQKEDVTYDLGWTPDASKGTSGGTLVWFARAAKELIAPSENPSAKD